MTAQPEEAPGSVGIGPCDHGHAVDMWNTKYPPPVGEVLHYTTSEWDAFVNGVKAGEFDNMVNEEES